MLLIQRAFKKKMFILKCKIRAVDVNREWGIGHEEGGGGVAGNHNAGRLGAVRFCVHSATIILV